MNDKPVFCRAGDTWEYEPLMVPLPMASLPRMPVANLVADCTTPTGKCYQQQQQINAQNRARLINATVAANYCSQRTKSLDAMQACVSRTLQEIGDK